MSNSFEKSVKGGTKIKLAAPKSKYVEHILIATQAGDAGVAEVFRTLQHRLRDSTWTIVFKALILTHLMIREGEANVTLGFLAENPSKLAISNFSDVQVQGSNIRHYYNYILSRAKSFRDTKLDWVRDGQGRLKKQNVDKGLLRETESVQKQISALLQCELLTDQPENEITLTAFRLLTMDLLALYHVMNEGTINVLEHYFEMSRYDAERALAIYKTFSKQTNEVVEFLSVARQFEHSTRLEIPKLKHAPTSLTASLEEYLSDPDFEINRRQYLAQQDAKKGSKPASNGAKETSQDPKKFAPSTSNVNKALPSDSAPPYSEPKGPAPDLIDFFESIEQNQQPMTAQTQRQSLGFQPQQQFQQTQVSGFSGQAQQQNPNFQPQPQLQYQVQNQGFPPQQQSIFSNSAQSPSPVNSPFNSGNPFSFAQPQQPQTNFTGNGFGGFSQQLPQSSLVQQTTDLSNAQQNSSAPFQSQANTGPFSPQQQSTNPFRQSMMPQQTTSSTPSFASTPPAISPISRQSTNPFAKSASTPFSSVQTTGTSFSTPASPQNSQSPFPNQHTAQSLQPQRTGTNPFARQVALPQAQQTAASPLVPQPTGSTNPFRQSMFANQETGQGWQSSQGSMGGLEQLPTIPVFPRTSQ